MAVHLTTGYGLGTTSPPELSGKKMIGRAARKAMSNATASSRPRSVSYPRGQVPRQQKTKATPSTPSIKPRPTPVVWDGPKPRAVEDAEITSRTFRYCLIVTALFLFTCLPFLRGDNAGWFTFWMLMLIGAEWIACARASSHLDALIQKECRWRAVNSAKPQPPAHSPASSLVPKPNVLQAQAIRDRLIAEQKVRD